MFELYDTRFISADFEKQQNGSSSSTSSGSTSDNHSTQVTTATSSTSVDITNTAGTSVCIATTTPVSSVISNASNASPIPSVANNVSVTTVSPSASQPQPTSKPTSSDNVLLRGKDGGVGEFLERQFMAISSTTAVSLLLLMKLFKLACNHGLMILNEELCKGVIVQWPEMNITRVENFSPIHTRKRKGRH